MNSAANSVKNRRGPLAGRLTLLAAAASLGTAVLIAGLGTTLLVSGLTPPAAVPAWAATVTRGWIGIQIQPVTAEIADSLGLKQAEGALVAEAQSDGPAAKAGIQTGDIITSVNAEAIQDARDLAKKIGAMTPGSKVKLGIVRSGDTKTLSMTLGELPQERSARADAREPAAGGDAPRLGLALAPAGKVAGAGGKGVVVTAVDPDSRAAEHGFKAGDVIFDVAGKGVSDPAEVRKALADARADAKRNVLMRVKSGDATRFVVVSIARA